MGTRSGTRIRREVLARRSGSVSLGRAPIRFAYGNADESGFFRPWHEPAELEALVKGRRRLNEVERLGLLEHQWAMVRSRRAPIASYLDSALAFTDETDPDVLATLPGPLSRCASTVQRTLGDDAERAFRMQIAEAFGPAFKEMGWTGPKRETDAERMRRAMLLTLVGRVGQDEAVRLAKLPRAAYVGTRAIARGAALELIETTLEEDLNGGFPDS